MFCRYRKRGTNVLSVHIGRAIQFYSRCSGAMHFRCLSAKRVFYIGDGSTLVEFLVLKCFCFCVFLFFVLLSSSVFFFLFFFGGGDKFQVLCMRMHDLERNKIFQHRFFWRLSNGDNAEWL